MKTEQKKTEQSQKKDQILNDVLVRKKAPAFMFVVLLLLYLLATVFVSRASRSQEVIFVAGKVLPISAFAGVLSSISNICIIFLAVFYRKTGFIVSLVILVVQFPVLLVQLSRMPTLGSLPGVFSNILVIIAIILIYSNDRTAERFQTKLRDQAVIDALTGMPNRFACTSLLDQLVQAGDKFTIVSIDLNKFKSINDTMGHKTGNAVLQILADRWMTLVEMKTTGTNDFVARLSGDEFALVIRGYDTEETARRTIQQYQSALDQTITVDECDYHLQASFGYAEFPKDAASGDALLTCSDVAMNEAKRLNAGTSVVRFEKEQLSLGKTVEIEQKIREALEQDRFFFHLQPQYDCAHTLRGFEVLARMTDSEGQMISPVDFIPVSERVGLVNQIDRTVFRKAAIFFGKLLEKTQADISLSVNVSVQHLMKNGFIEEVQSILAESGVPAGQIEIEITESIMIDSAEKALERINELKQMGLKIAIDDFGTGYSSLSYLKRFPADLLKVDKSFVDEMNSNDSSRQYVAAIISIGHIMNQKVIAEGVEEAEQVDALRGIGCDYIQGFYWGRPMMPDEAEKLVDIGA